MEHRFGLSNQNFSQWLRDLGKKTLLSFVLSLGLLECLYWIIRQCPASWWLWAWAAYALVSYVLGKLFPVFLVPLFYKYGKLEDKALEEKVLKLAARFGLPAENVYSLNLSKTTKGISRTRKTPKYPHARNVKSKHAAASHRLTNRREVTASSAK